MKILLDTHIFLWLRVAPEKVSEPVLTAFYDVNKENSVIILVTVHVTTRQPIKFRLQTGRFTHESTPLF